MKLTNLDTDLILALMELGGGSTTRLANALFNPEDEYELRKYDSKIRYRLERMRKKDLLKKNGVKYDLNVERVFLTPATLELDIGVKIAMGMMLVVYPKDDELIMRQLRFEETSKKLSKIFQKPL